MECCKCEKGIDLKQEDTYFRDYIGEVWCKACIREEYKVNYKS